jgi:hypothetical protein
MLVLTTKRGRGRRLGLTHDDPSYLRVDLIIAEWRRSPREPRSPASPTHA